VGVFNDLTGHRFGRLTVIKRTNEVGLSTGVRWLCVCDCGKDVVFYARSLIKGHHISCGCLRREHCIPRQPKKAYDKTANEHISTELELGKAGEYLTMVDLLLHGEKAFLTDQGINYDIVVEIEEQLFRMQVKTTARKKVYGKKHTSVGEGYYLHLRRAGKCGKRVRGNKEFELYAVAMLDIKTVAYILSEEAPQGLMSFRDERDAHTERLLKLKGNTLSGNHVNLRFIQDYTWERVRGLLLEKTSGSCVV